MSIVICLCFGYFSVHMTTSKCPPKLVIHYDKIIIMLIFDNYYDNNISGLCITYYSSLTVGLGDRVCTLSQQGFCWQNTWFESRMYCSSNTTLHRTQIYKLTTNQILLKPKKKPEPKTTKRNALNLALGSVLKWNTPTLSVSGAKFNKMCFGVICVSKCKTTELQNTSQFT